MHLLFLLSRVLIFRASLTRSTWLLYLLLSSPAAIIQLMFERNSRPTFGPDGELKRGGDDLEAKGMTEYMFDVMYWTWGCVVMAALFGDRLWWAWSAVPVYSAWAAYAAFTGIKGSLSGMAGPAGEPEGMGSGVASKRQQKLEKRGGQKVQYRA